VASRIRARLKFGGGRSGARSACRGWPTSRSTACETGLRPAGAFLAPTQDRVGLDHALNRGPSSSGLHEELPADEALSWAGKSLSRYQLATLDVAMGKVYIGCIYFAEERAMAKAKLFMSGGSQAVRLPAKFRFEGSEVDIRRDPVTGEVVLSKPTKSWDDYFDWVRKLDFPDDFLKTRDQPQDDLRDGLATRRHKRG